MTVIVYGKSTFAGNAKTRRHERRRKLAIERDSISGSVCLPNVAIYAAGYRKSKQLTAR